MLACSLESFRLEDGVVHVLARGPLVVWAGTLADVVGDAESRARFRLALDCADRALRVAGTIDPQDRLTLVWDLEGAEPLPEAGGAPRFAYPTATAA
ncbi:MAG: hypothetical protein ACO1OK_04185 [Devosia sp.]